MVRKVQLSPGVPHKRLWYGFGATCIGLVALLLLLSLSKNAGLAAPLAPTAITITKSSTTSIIGTNNTASQAVAGELVTVTVVYTVSEETIYAASPRVVLEDGLLPTGSSPAWSNMYTGTQTVLRGHEGSGTHIIYQSGALVIFPDQGTITGTDRITMTVYAVRTQRRYALPPYAEITDGTNLRIQGILRYCLDPSCTTSDLRFTPGNDTTGQVTARQPQVNTTYGAPVYLDSLAIGEGGGQVRLTFTAAAAGGRPTAYDIVYTVTLNAGLTYFASSGGNGAGPGTVSTVGDVTYVVWNVPISLLNPQTWQAVVTATLPTTFTIGQQFTYLGTAAYQTFAGNVPYEGKYVTAGALQTLRPGLATVIKTSNPGGGAVTMGDVVTYTVIFRQGANTLLQAPQIVDTQPLGFHYISGTLEVQNATVTSVDTSQGTTEGSGTALRHYEDLTWTMSDLLPLSTTRVVTATYVALNTGLDYNNLPVYTLAADLRTSKPTISASKTGAVLSWTPPAGSTYNSATRANAGALGVIQPFMGDNFSTVRTDTGLQEVNGTLQFATRFRNNGYSAAGIPAIPAHELQVCDTLPAGLIFQTDNGCFLTGTSNTCSFSYTPPAVGATGEICWSVPVLDKRADANTYEFRYDVWVTDAAYPGVYGNLAFVKTYSSKAGTVEGERVYADIPTALASATCGTSCYTIVGLDAAKYTSQNRVAPGDLITYVLAYTDTSPANAYTGLVVVDTYDSLLTFVSANPAPSSHNVGTRQLTWNLGALPNDTSGRITLVMQVASTVAGRYMITNTMTLDSDQTALRTWIKTTPIEVATLHLSMSGPARTHAGEDIVYTVVYSNTGSWNNAPVTLTLTYGDYVTFVGASATPVDAENRVFVDNVPNDGSNRTLTVNLRVKAPLPYTLAGPLMASALLQSPGAATQSANISMLLDRPILTLEKIGPAVAPAPGVIAPYAIWIRNSGTYTATSMVITDTWGANLIYNATANSAFGWTLSGSGTYATQTLPTLAPGDVVSRSFYADVGAMATYYTNTVDLTTYQTTRQTDTEWTWQVTIASSKSAMPVPAFPGRVLTYTIYYTNTGGAMLNALITDTLPAAFTYQGQSTEHANGCQNPWTFTPPSAGNQVVWSCNALQAGKSGYFQIWGLVDVAAEGTNLENRTTTSADDTPVRPIEQPLVTRVARPWLRVDKTAAPTHPVAPGDPVTYTLTYENYGTDTAYGVIIKDQLPTQMDFVSCSGADSCAESGGVVTWNLAELPISTTGTVQFVAQVKAGTAGQTAVNENYTIECSLLSITETQAGGAVSTVIKAPELTLVKSAAPANVYAVNDLITYTLSYQNVGGGLLHHVVLTDDLSTQTTFADASPNCEHLGSGVGGQVICRVGTLENGASGAVQIRVRVGALSSGDIITNQVQARVDELTTAIMSNLTQVCFGGTCGSPRIGVTPQQVTHTTRAGQTFTDTLTINNTGELQLTWSLQEQPPAGWIDASPSVGFVPAGDSAQVTLYFDSTGRSVGDYQTILRITSNDPVNSTVDVPVTLRVRAPQVSVAPTSIVYTITVGAGAFTAPLFITNTGEVPLTWILAESPAAAWLGQSSNSGSLAVGNAVQVTLTFTPTGLAAGDYSAALNISAGDGGNTVSVPVTLRVRAPQISVAPTSIVYTVTVGTGAFTAPLFITNTGEVPLTWTLAESPAAAWLGQSSNSGSLAVGSAVQVTLTFTPTELALGDHITALDITSGTGGNAVNVPVRLHIKEGKTYIFLPLVLRNQ